MTAVIVKRMNDTIATSKSNTTTTTTTTTSRRLVVFIGPPKTASTSLQSFLSQYASNDQPKTKASPAFDDWNYPKFFKSAAGLKWIRYGPTRAANYAEAKYMAIRAKLLEQPRDLNLVVGTEYLVHFDKMGAMEALQNWTDTTPEVVIQYRSPRLAHFLSIWKQQVQLANKPLHGLSFQRYLCDEKLAEATVLVRLNRFTNVLHLAQVAIETFGYPTYLIDMGGVPGDISHAFACGVLQVPCKDGIWIDGIKGKTLRKNSRKANPHLSTEQFEQLEEVFTQRDCTYYEELHNHPLLTILHRNNLFKNNCTTTTPNFRYRTNARHMLQRMREIVQCPGMARSSNASISIIGSNNNEETHAVDADQTFTPLSASSSPKHLNVLNSTAIIGTLDDATNDPTKNAANTNTNTNTTKDIIIMLVSPINVTKNGTTVSISPTKNYYDFVPPSDFFSWMQWAGVMAVVISSRLFRKKRTGEGAKSSGE